jgi:hypothetical protein
LCWWKERQDEEVCWVVQGEVRPDGSGSVLEEER